MNNIERFEQIDFLVNVGALCLWIAAICFAFIIGGLIVDRWVK